MDKPKKRIAVLGSTGSIGTQTLDVVRRNPDKFEITVLTARRSADRLIAQALEFRPQIVVITDQECYSKVKEALEPEGIEVASGNAAIAETMRRPCYDMVVTATVGYSGLEPTLAAIAEGKDIALANKETMVVAGELVTRLLADSQTKIYPVDSEHSAIFQCLAGENMAEVDKLIITASGGPFRTMSRQEMEHVTVGDALRHPKWSMGAKITIDSATMLNKAFEIIEARWLFGVAPEKIEAVVHPQSIVHSMVQFSDGAIKAQLGQPDMHLPISYALGMRERLRGAEAPLSVADYGMLTFEKPDPERFPCLGLAQETLKKGGTSACVVNAANEIAVDAFLHEKIRYLDIYDVIRQTLDDLPQIQTPAYSDYVKMNAQAREYAAKLVEKLCRKQITTI